MQGPSRGTWNTGSRQLELENFGLLVLSKCTERIHKLSNLPRKVIQPVCPVKEEMSKLTKASLRLSSQFLLILLLVGLVPTTSSLVVLLSAPPPSASIRGKKSQTHGPHKGREMRN